MKLRIFGLIAVAGLTVAGCSSSGTHAQAKSDAHAKPNAYAQEATACKTLLASQSSGPATTAAMSKARRQAAGTHLAELIDGLSVSDSTTNISQLDDAATAVEAECHRALGT
ncbi:MAG TPA: hypothetical protein VH914_03085 [Acidimicrobiia bacterium]|jgi:hypothetical protein|nr:hypothetical protein [Acidimicrobiia bacterium]